MTVMPNDGPVDGRMWEHLRMDESMGFTDGGLYHLEAIVALRVLRNRLDRLGRLSRPGDGQQHTLLETYERLLDHMEHEVRSHGAHQRWEMETKNAKVVFSADELRSMTTEEFERLRDLPKQRVDMDRFAVAHTEKPCSADHPCDEYNALHVVLFGSCFSRREGGVIDELRRPTVD